MSNNPYQPTSYSGSNINPSDQVKAPAIALIVISSISLFVLIISIAIDIFMLVSGMAQNMQQPEALGISKEAQIGVRMAWSALIRVTSGVVLAAGIKMLQRKSYSFCRVGSILAMVPCLGPCCLLGIPIGIWAFITLNQPGVSRSFDS